MINKKVLVIGALCALVTVVTTFVVHLIEIPAATFDERLQLSQNSTYLWRNVTTIVHCICVAISMAAMAHARKGSSNSVLANWGAVAFLIFSLAEIARMMTALVYINGLRAQYLASADAAQQELIKFTLETQWPLIGTILFIIFIIAFGFGCLFMGLGLVDRNSRLNTITGALFIFWAVQSFATIGNSTLGWGLDGIIYWLSITFQPSMRALAAVWLFLASRRGTV